MNELETIYNCGDFILNGEFSQQDNNEIKSNEYLMNKNGEGVVTSSCCVNQDNQQIDYPIASINQRLFYFIYCSYFIKLNLGVLLII